MASLQLEVTTHCFSLGFNTDSFCNITQFFLKFQFDLVKSFVGFCKISSTRGFVHQNFSRFVYDLLDLLN